MSVEPEMPMAIEAIDELLEEAENAIEPVLLQGVEVRTDRAEGRKRQISASIYLGHSVEQVWQILTDYDHLADFIPNLSQSRRLDHPECIQIEQIGAESFMRLKFRARVVLEMTEHFPHRIGFHMIEGDFKEFSGSWTLQPNGTGTELGYTLQVLPPRTMPVALIERRLKAGLVMNLTAIRDRADQLFGQA